jgi:hypothetical protein
MFILANGTNRWIVMVKFSKFKSSSGATLVMEKKVLKHFMGNGWLMLIMLSWFHHIVGY